MAVIKRHAPGTFSWTDLGTTNVASAKKFYTGVFGWKVKDRPMGPGDEKYSLLRVSGKDACALYPMADEQRKAKMPPAWMPYIAVKNADATVRKVRAKGGKVLSKPMDVWDLGRMAIVSDPAGAIIGLWQARKHRGSAVGDVPGTVAWHDLNTTKTKAASKFYTSVFGWTAQTEDFSGNAYHLFKLGRKNAGGMWPQPMKKMPNSWLTYWEVKSCPRTVTKTKKLGGRVLMGTTPVPGMGRFAVLADPQGAPFGVIEFA